MEEESPNDAFCRTRLIPDEPTSRDALGPHDRVAGALHRLIEDEAPSVVGIRGEYGSGKSTVIRLLQERLSSDANTFVWVFDAWAHEGNPLRRTFLESFIDALLGKDKRDAESWLEDPKAWERERKRLAAQEKTAETTTTPQVGTLGLIFTLVLLLLPPAYVWVRAVQDSPEVWWRVGAMVVALLPFLVAVGAVVWASGTVIVSAVRARRSRDGDRGLRARSPEESPWEEVLKQVSSLVVREANKTEREETYEQPEPTSLEFERTFNDVVREALEGRGRKLVLVIDNLDRLPFEDSLRMWSTLRTFLEPSARNGWADRATRPWILVPYTSPGLHPVHDPFATGRPAETRPTDTGLTRPSDPAGMIEKVIETEFEVPRPFLPDWRRFLLKTLERALPDHTGGEEEFHRIYRLVALECDPETDPPTPRQLISIVNEIGTIHRLRGHEVRLEHIAYYVLLRRRGVTDLPRRLREEDDFPEREALAHLHEDVEAELAALWYGLFVHAARKLLYMPVFRGALEAGDPHRIDGLVDEAEAAVPILEETVQRAREDWGTGEVEKLLRGARAISRSEALLRREGPERSALLRELRAAVASSPSLPAIGDRVASEGFIALARSREGPGLVDRLRGALQDELEEGSLGEEPGKHREVLREAVWLYGQLEEEFGEGVAPSPLEVPGDFSAYRDLFVEVRKAANGGAVSKVFRPQPEGDELVEGVKGVVHGEDFDDGALEALWACAGAVTDQGRKEIAQAIRKRLTFTNTGSGAKRRSELEVEPGELDALISALDSIADPEGEVLSALASAGVLAHAAHRFHSADSVESRARVLHAYLGVAPELPEPRDQGKAVQGIKQLRGDMKDPPEGYADALAEIVRREGTVGRVLQLLDNSEDGRNLGGAVIRELAEDRDASQTFPLELWLSHWDVVRENVDEWCNLLSSSPHYRELKERVLEEPINDSNAGLLGCLLELEPENSDLQKLVLDKVRNLSENEWREALAEERPSALDIASQLEELEQSVEAEQPLREALRSVAREMIDADEPPEGASRADDAVRLLSSENRSAFREELLEMLYGCEGQASPPFYETWGDEAALADRFAKDSRTARELVEPIMKRLDKTEVYWLKQAIEKHPSLEGGLDPWAVDLIKKSVRRRLKRKGEEESDLDRFIRGIANALGIKASSKT